MSATLLTLEPDETARAYLARAFAAPRLLGIPALDAAPCRGGEIVELYGEPQTGKSELLYRCAATWALPASRGGGGRRVVLFDTEHKFQLPRLRAVVAAVAAAFPAADDAEPAAAAADAALNRILIAPCGTTLDFLCQLELVEQRAESEEAPLLLVDSIGAFLFTEDRPADRKLAAPSLTHAAVRAIARLLARRRATLVAAKPAYYEAKAGDPRGDYHPEYLPRAWTALVKRRVCLSRESRTTHGPCRVAAKYGDFDADARRPTRHFSFQLDARGCSDFKD